MLVQVTQIVQGVVFHDVESPAVVRRRFDAFTMRNARFVQVGTRKGSAFTSVEELGRGCGSVFHHHFK